MACFRILADPFLDIKVRNHVVSHISGVALEPLKLGETEEGQFGIDD
jgi:hypothetical protein